MEKILEKPNPDFKISTEHLTAFITQRKNQKPNKAIETSLNLIRNK